MKREEEKKSMGLQITDLATKMIDNRSNEEIMYGKDKK